MDKQTFYSELSERLTKLAVDQDYISRHLTQFDSYFSGKSDEEISAEIEKLGDLDRVAARIKRMTDKLMVNETMAEISNNPSRDPKQKTAEDSEKNQVVTATPSDPFVGKETNTTQEQVLSDEDMIVLSTVDNAESPEILTDDHDISFSEPEFESHGTKRGAGLAKVTPSSDDAVLNVTMDDATVQNNRRKFWILFAITLPITLSVVLATAMIFVMTFFAIAVVIIFSIGALVAITALGTLISVFGIIFGVAQMLSSLPIGLYECGIAITIGAVAMFCGILVYNFAVRLMPYAAKWLLIFAKYVVRKYKELFVYLKKECIGL